MQNKQPNRISKILPFIICITVAVALIVLLVFVSPLLVMYYAEEQYFVDNYKENKAAFEAVKNELIASARQYDYDELLLTIDYDESGARIIRHYKEKEILLDLNASTEAYDSVNAAFGDMYWCKILISPEGVCLSEEGNNYQYVYTHDGQAPKNIFGSRDDKVRRLGDGWFLVVPD